MRSNRCPKCEGSMTEGFVLNHKDGSRAVSTWIPGPPEKSFWTGLRLSGRPAHQIQTSRCTRCGFLESYAPELALRLAHPGGSAGRHTQRHHADR